MLIHKKMNAEARRHKDFMHSYAEKIGRGNNRNDAKTQFNLAGHKPTG
jgi:hypothetical protein